MGGLSLSRNTGRQDQTLDLNDPNIQNEHGAFMNDVPVALKLSGLRIPLGNQVQRDLSALHRLSRGRHRAGHVETIALTQVSQSIRVEPRGDSGCPTRTCSTSVEERIQFGPVQC